jgi:hypothetical protein
MTAMAHSGPIVESDNPSEANLLGFEYYPVSFAGAGLLSFNILYQYLVLRPCGLQLSNPQVQTPEFQPLNRKLWIAFQNVLQPLNRLRGFSGRASERPR